MTMDNDIVRADPRFRRQAVLLLVVAAALGTAGIRWGLPWLEVARLTQPGVQRTICVTFAAVIVGLAALVVYSGRGSRDWAARRSSGSSSCHRG